MKIKVKNVEKNAIYKAIDKSGYIVYNIDIKL